MIKQYDKYKQSNFKWIEQIPEKWIEGKIAYYFEIGRGRVISELELNPDGLSGIFISNKK